MEKAIRGVAEHKWMEEMLRESEGKYRAPVESISDAIYSVDVDGLITWISPSIESLLGYSQSEALERHFKEFFLPDDLPLLDQSFQDLLAGHSQEHEYRLVTKSGEVRWIRTCSRPVFSAKGVVGVHGVLSDITERKQSEEALRESEERLRGILSALHETFVIVYDRQCRHLSVWGPPELEERYGVRISDIIGKSLPEVFPSGDVQSRVAEIQRVFETGESLRTELVLDYPKGSFWHDVTYSPLCDSQGQVSAVVAFVREITERVRVEKALRESEEKWRSLVENAPELILMVDADGKILFINRVPEGSTYSVEQIVGASADQFVLPEYRGVVRSAIREVFETGNSIYYEVAAPRPDGVTAWFATKVGPIQTGGEISSAILLARDISERKQVDELKDNLIRDVSHELRTPLAKMQMSLELLLEMLGKEQIDGQRAARIGEMVYGNVRRLLQTVEAILDLSSLEAGQVIFATMEILPADLVNEASLYIKPVAEAKGLALETALPEELPPVEGDWEQLFRVFVNLLGNAIKFSEGGKIVVFATVQPQHVEFSVSDTGCGIRQENLPHVFDRFYQERARFDGAGVGLTICERIVEAHGGRIWAESPGRGQGATLRFTLPILGQGG